MALTGFVVVAVQLLFFAKWKARVESSRILPIGATLILLLPSCTFCSTRLVCCDAVVRTEYARCACTRLFEDTESFMVASIGLNYEIIFAWLSQFEFVAKHFLRLIKLREINFYILF